MDQERRSIDWIIVGLVLVIVSSPALALVAANWTDGMESLWVAAIVGIAVGLVISISRFHDLTAHLFSTVYGLVWAGYLMLPVQATLTLREKILDVYFRIVGFTALAIRGGTGRDSMMFVLVLSLLFWWVGYIAIWNTIRYQRVWRVLLPPGVALIINLYYYAGSVRLAVYLMVYLLSALLIIVRSNTVLQESRWLKEKIGFNSDVRFDLLRSGIVLATLAVLLAWVAPTAATSEQAYDLWRRVEGPWRRVEEDFTRLFSTLRSQARAYGNPFGRMITLRGPRTLADVMVLEVVAPQERRLYWRGVTYDRYTGSSWINSDNESAFLDAPWRQIRIDAYSLREEITQTVILHLPINTLVFAAPDPVRLDLVANADAHYSRDGTAEFSQIISSKTLRNGNSYQVVSSISAADPDSLRSAGINYPAWVRERYLQLPESLPLSVRNQAKSIAGELPTAYDKAAVIEAWLRANVVYDDKTPAPPENQDGVEYLLAVKRGYCDYYASAMVVMLRSLGVPARLAVGYAQGRYDEQLRAFRVSEKDSHSWAEVYFPTYGWVEFEPTASQPLIERPKPQAVVQTPTPAPGASGQGGPPPMPTDDTQDPMFRRSRGLGAGLRSPVDLTGLLWGLGIIGGLAAVVLAFLWTFEQRGLGGLTRTARVYARLLRFSGWLNVLWKDSFTPRERGQAFCRAAPQAHGLILQVVDNYTREQYAPIPPEASASDRTWRALRPLLWIAGVRQRVERFRRRVHAFRLWWDSFTNRYNRQFGA